jgi:hypothetical protein
MRDRDVRLVCCSARGNASNALESSFISLRLTSKENDGGSSDNLLCDRDRRWRAVSIPISMQTDEMMLWDRSMTAMEVHKPMRVSTSLRRFCRRMTAEACECVEKREYGHSCMGNESERGGKWRAGCKVNAKERKQGGNTLLECLH